MGLCTSSICKSGHKRSRTPDTFGSEDTNLPEEEFHDPFFLVREITREWLEMATRPPSTPMFGSATPVFGVNESLT